MAALPTGYANSTTPSFVLAANGGGGANQTFDSVSIVMPPSGPIRSSVMGSGYDVYDGAKQIAMLDPSGNLGPLQLGGYLEVQDVDAPDQAQGRMLYESAAIDWEQPLTGTSFYFMTVDKTTQKFDISNVQSINGGPPVPQSGVGTYDGSPTVVAFATPFANPPKVFVQTTNNDSAVDGFLYVSTPTPTTEFTVLSSGSNANIQFFWMAME